MTRLALHDTAARPDANLVIVEDRGHRSTMERPAAVNAALFAWLAG